MPAPALVIQHLEPEWPYAIWEVALAALGRVRQQVFARFAAPPAGAGAGAGRRWAADPQVVGR